MEAFNEKVGIPQDRASEGVFKFDGDKLNPDGTPEASSRHYHSGGGGSGICRVTGHRRWRQSLAVVFVAARQGFVCPCLVILPLVVMAVFRGTSVYAVSV